MMLWSYMMVFMTVIMYAMAYPTNLTSGTPVERAYPTIQVGVFSPEELAQIYQAHHDAIQLASITLSWSKDKLGSDSGRRFRNLASKYFVLNDLSTVLDVLHAIVNADDGMGHPWLSQLIISADWTDKNGYKTCDKFLGEFRPDDQGKPRIVLCPGLFKYPKINDITCESLYPRISYKMVTLGHVMLHEYFHWPDLTYPLISKTAPVRLQHSADS